MTADVGRRPVTLVEWDAGPGRSRRARLQPAADPTRRRCESLDGDLIDPVDVVIAALIGQVRRIVYDSASCVIDLGVAGRMFRGNARLAVWLQGTRCL